MSLKVRVKRMSGAEVIVEMKAFPQGEISRRDYDRAVKLTREAGRGDILGVVEGRIIEPLSKAQVEQIKAQTMSGRQYYGMVSGLAEMHERQAAREGACNE